MGGCCPPIQVDANRHLTTVISYGLQDMEGQKYGIYPTTKEVLAKKEELASEGITTNVYETYSYTED